MSPRSKREYTEAIHKRYKHASRSEKKIILDEFCATTGYHRKYAIVLLKGFKRFRKPVRKRRGPKPTYKNDEIIKPSKKIWLAANLPCSKRLKVILPLWLPGYSQQFGMLPLDIVQALRHISPSTIDRLLKPVRARYGKHGRSTTKPGTLLRKQIPIATNQWDESRPGFLEADMVAHCGDTTAGTYVATLDLVDIATGWTEQRAVWGKGERGVLEQIADVEHRCPFRYSGLIVIMAQSFSTTTSCDTLRKEQSLFPLPEAGRTIKTTMPISSRRTGPMYGNGWDMNGSMIPHIVPSSQ